MLALVPLTVERCGARPRPPGPRSNGRSDGSPPNLRWRWDSLALKFCADEEFLGSFAAIASALISFCKKTNLPVYIRIAEALEELDAPQLAVPLCVTVAKV